MTDLDVVDTEPRGGELVRAPATAQPLMPMDPGQVVAGMRAYQQLMRDLLEPSDWQSEDANGQRLDQPFPKKSAWRKIARAFNLSFEIVSRDVVYDDQGDPIRAEAIIRAIAPNGQYGDADGYCSRSEFTGRRGRDSKLENTMRATASTRAKNRAIADLVGMGEVSAEELDVTLNQAQASEALKERVGQVIGYLFDGDQDAAEGATEALAQHFEGGLPVSAGQALTILGAHVKRYREAVSG